MAIVANNEPEDEGMVIDFHSIENYYEPLSSVDIDPILAGRSYGQKEIIRLLKKLK